MKESNRIHIDSLEEEAKKSEEKEAFKVLVKMQNCRVGAGARYDSADNLSFFVEVLLNLCASNNPMNLDLVEKNLVLLRRIEERGYVLSCEEDGSILCELTVSSKNLISECEVMNSIVRRAFLDCLDNHL